MTCVKPPRYDSFHCLAFAVFALNSLRRFQGALKMGPSALRGHHVAQGTVFPRFVFDGVGRLQRFLNVPHFSLDLCDSSVRYRTAIITFLDAIGDFQSFGKIPASGGEILRLGSRRGNCHNSQRSFEVFGEVSPERLSRKSTLEWDMRIDFFEIKT